MEGFDNKTLAAINEEEFKKGVYIMQGDVSHIRERMDEFNVLLKKQDERIDNKADKREIEESYAKIEEKIYTAIRPMQDQVRENTDAISSIKKYMERITGGIWVVVALWPVVWFFFGPQIERLREAVF